MFADTSILDAIAAVTLATIAAVTVNVAAAIAITAIIPIAAAFTFLLGALLLHGLVVVFVVIIVHFNFLLR